jgi:ubiquinone/menaquinone biosynthesis C-methylase UbiE
MLALLDAAGVGTGTRVLDVGTGPGVVAEFGSLAARYATGDGAVTLPASAVLASGTRP